MKIQIELIETVQGEKKKTTFSFHTSCMLAIKDYSLFFGDWLLRDKDTLHLTFKHSDEELA